MKSMMRFFGPTALMLTAIFALPTSSAAQVPMVPGQENQSTAPKPAPNLPETAQGGKQDAPAKESNEPTITYYDFDGTGKTSGKMPEFTGAVVSIQFVGSAEVETRRQLMKLGVRAFASSCSIPGKPVICFSFEKPVDAGTVNDYGSWNASGGRSSWSNSSNESGQRFEVATRADLYDGHGKVTPLAIVYHGAFVGYSSGWNSFSGSDFGTSSNFNDTTPEAFAVGGAVMAGVNDLVGNRLIHRGKGKGWFPGAAADVSQAFRQETELSHR